MSHIGSRKNITQPSRQCFGCKYWKPAQKAWLLAESGHCRKAAAYSRKNKVILKRIFEKKKTVRKDRLLCVISFVFRQLKGIVCLTENTIYLFGMECKGNLLITCENFSAFSVCIKKIQYQGSADAFLVFPAYLPQAVFFAFKMLA